MGYGLVLHTVPISSCEKDMEPITNWNKVIHWNNESIGTANFVHYLEVFFLERYKSIEEYANDTLEKFHYERLFTIGGVHYRRFHCTWGYMARYEKATSQNG